MGRKATLEANYDDSKKLWCISIPARFSSTGKRQREYFKTKKKADSRTKILKAMEKECEGMSRHVSTSLIEDAVYCDQMAQIYGFSGLKEAFQSWAQNADTEKATPTFNELIQAYENANSSNWSERYISCRWKTFANHVEDLLETQISDLDFEFWQSWLNKWRVYKVGIPKQRKNFPDIKSSETQNNFVATLRAVFSQPLARRTYPENPILDIKTVYNLSDQEICVFSPKESKVLLDTAWKHDKEMIPFIATGIFCGARPESELSILTWEDFNWEEDWILVKSPKTRRKGINKRYVPLSENLKLWLTPWKDASGLIKVESNHRRRLEAIRAKAGLILNKQGKEKQKLDNRSLMKLFPWGADIMRHSYGSYLEAQCRHTKNGKSTVMANMGHSNLKTFEQYYLNSRTPKQAEEFWSITPPCL